MIRGLRISGWVAVLLQDGLQCEWEITREIDLYGGGVWIMVAFGAVLELELTLGSDLELTGSE